MEVRQVADRNDLKIDSIVEVAGDIHSGIELAAGVTFDEMIDNYGKRRIC